MRSFFRFLISLLSKSRDAKELESEVCVLGEEDLPNVTTGGLKAIAIIGDYDPSKLPKATSEITIILKKGKQRKAECGHESQKEIHYNVYGEQLVGDGARICPDCGVAELTKIVICCPLCGLPILPGSGVSIYDASSKDLKLERAYIVDGTSVLGCLRMDCGIPGAFGGYWMGPDEGFRPYDFSKSAVG